MVELEQPCPAVGAMGLPSNEVEMVKPETVQQEPPEGEPFNRDRLMSNIADTATPATLIAGFALGFMQNFKPEDDFLNMGIYILACMAVHSCTLSALVSAVLVLTANTMRD